MAATVQELIVKYRADVSELQGKVEQIEKALTKSGKAGEDAGKKIKKGLDDAHASASPLGESFAKLGPAIIAAFSIGAIVSFGKESLKAFQDAELSARKLQSAVSASGGIQENFEKLLAQSKKLQETTIFSDEDIQNAQTLALQFGINANAVEDLIPKVADFASATGQDLNSALSAVLRGVEGNARGLKLFGVQVDENQSKAERFDSIMGQLNSKFSGQAGLVAATSGGSLKVLANLFDDAKEKLGEFISNAIVPGIGFLKDLFTTTEAGVDPLVKIQQEFNNEVNALKAGNLSHDERKLLIDQINTKYKTYLPNLITEKTSLEDITKAQSSANDQFIKRIALAAQENDIAKISKTLSDAISSNVKIEIQRAAIQRDSADLLGTNTAQLQRLDAVQKVNNETINTGKKGLADLTAQYDELAKQLGITKTASSGLDTTNPKAIEAARKAAEAATKSQEELRKFTLKSLTDNLKDEEAIQKQKVASEILTDEQRAVKLIQIELNTLNKIKALNAEFSESSDINSAIINKKIELNQAIQKVDEDFIKKGLAQNLASVDIGTEERKKKLIASVGDISKLTAEEREKQERKLQDGLKLIELSADIEKQNIRLDTFKEGTPEYLDAVTKLGADENEIKALGLKTDVDNTKNAEDKKKAIRAAAIQSSQQALNDLIDFSLAASQRNTDAQLKIVETKLETDLAALDEEQAKAEGTFKKKTAVEIKYEAQRKALREKAAAEERKLRTDQARKEKEAAIIKAIINTAVAVTEVLAVPVLAAIVAALGAIEIGLIAAQPLPQFAKGTKGAQGGLSMVGERGVELMFVPSQAKILPNDKVNRYGEMIDAMYDSTIDNYILNKYVAPALKKQQQISQNFAQNVTNNIDYTRFANDIAYALRGHKVELTQDNIDSLSKAITQNIPQNNPRKW